MKISTIYQKFLGVIALLLFTTQVAWGISKTQLTVNISGSGQIAVNTSSAQPSGWSSTSVTKSQSHGTFDIKVEDTYYIWVNPTAGYYCSGVSDCSWNNDGYYTIKFKGSTTTTEKTVTVTFVGNSYTLTFDGNGETSGSMSDQGFVYGTSKVITANAFKREFAITYDADGGECGTTGATAKSNFAGWAKSATGDVVFTDKQALSTPTPLPAHNSTIGLYAKWDAASVTLPNVSKSGWLFDGWYNGDTWAGDIGDTYTATANATLTAHWAEKRTPVFVLDKTEIELEQSAVLTKTNVNNPSIQITPSGIVEYNAETGVLTGIGVGTVTISATQEATDELSYKHEELTLVVGKKTSNLSVLLNDIEQSIVTIYQGATGTANFATNSDANVVVTTVSGGQHASFANGVLTAGDIGTAVFRATVPETDTYKSTYVEFSVKVEKNPIHLEMTVTQAIWNNPSIKVGTSGTNSWDGDNQVRLGHGTNGGLKWDDKWITIHFEGIPDKLTFDYKYDYVTEGTKNSAVGIGQSADPNQKYFLYVEESNDNANWTALTWQSTDPFKDTWKSSGELQLKKATRYLRFHLHANLGAYYRNIHISELKYVQEPMPASVDFGTAVINTGEVSQNVNVNWCNVAPLSVTSSNPKFTATPSSFANYDDYGSQTITIKYNHTGEVGEFSGDIIISNGNSTYTRTIPVHAETTKRPQLIKWDAELSATNFAMNVGEQYPDIVIPVVATATSNERVTFTSSDPDIIEVVADTALLAKAIGDVTITAHQAGNAEYDAVDAAQAFVVTNKRKQSIVWDQNLYGLLTTSGSVELTATATSGGEIIYTSANPSIVSVSGNVLTVVGEGETYITATQAGFEDAEGEWLGVTATNYVIVRDPASQCNEKALAVNSLELNKDHLSQEYDLVGVPSELTFVAMHGEKSGQWGTGASYATLVVEQYAYINSQWDWYQVFSQVVGTSNAQYGAITLDESAIKVRFATGETAVSHTISNIRIARKKFMRANVESVDLEVESNAIWSQNIVVSHSNIDLMTVSTKQGLLNFSTATLGDGCGDFGDDAFTASFTPMQKYVAFFDTIVISDGKADPSTIEIPVRLYSQGLTQVIEGFNLSSTAKTTDEITLSAVASSGLDVTYESSDENIVRVQGNQLEIITSGAVTITAKQEGNEKYDPVSESKQITISKAYPAITTSPVAELTYGQHLSDATITGGVADVEGTFAWADETIAPNAGTQEYAIVFIPTKTAWYENTNGTATVTTHKADASVTAPAAIDGLVYNTAAQTLVVSGSANGGTIEYSLDGTSYSTELPQGTNAGAYTTYYKVTGDANHNDIAAASITATIAKADASVTAPAAIEGLVYNTAAQTLVASGSANGGTIEYSLDGTSYSTELPQGTNAGAYTTYYKVTGDANHNDIAAASITATIAKADASVTAPAAIEGLVYNTAAQTLVASGSANGGTIEYSLDGTSYSTELPQGTNAGAYTTYYKVTGDANHNDIAAATLESTISKATPAVTTAPTATPIEYKQNLAASTLNGGAGSVEGTFAWTDETIAPTAGEHEYSVTFTPSDADNYNTASKNVTVIVNKATPVVTWPTANSISYGHALSEATLLGGTHDVAGTFAWENGSEIINELGEYQRTVVFTPTDALNYNSVHELVSVTVGKAKPSITAWPTASGITYGDNLSASTLNGGTTAVAGSFAWKDGEQALMAGEHQCIVVFTPNDLDNYSAVNEQITVTVAKATPAVTTAPTATAINYTDKLAASTLEGGAGTVDGTFAWTDANIAPTAGEHEYSVTFTPSDATNYTTVSTNVTILVNKAVPQITTAPVVSAAIEYGQTLAQALLNSGAANVGGTFTWEEPTTQPKAGVHEYTVIFTPNDQVNYEPTTTKVSVTINKKGTEIKTLPEGVTITRGKTLSSAELVGGAGSVDGSFIWANGSLMPEMGEGDFDVIFTPTDNENYKTASGKVHVIIDKGIPEVRKLPTANANGATYGVTLADVTLSGGYATVQGSFAWEDATIKPTAGTHKYNVVFSPSIANSDEFGTTTCEVSVAIGKATPEIIDLPTAYDIEEGDRLEMSWLGGGEATTEGAFEWKDVDLVPEQGTSQQTVVFVPTDLENYNMVEALVEVIVKAKDVTTDLNEVEEAGALKAIYSISGQLITNDPANFIPTQGTYIFLYEKGVRKVTVQ